MYFGIKYKLCKMLLQCSLFDNVFLIFITKEQVTLTKQNSCTRELSTYKFAQITLHVACTCTCIYK